MQARVTRVRVVSLEHKMVPCTASPTAVMEFYNADGVGDGFGNEGAGPPEGDVQP